MYFIGTSATILLSGNTILLRAIWRRRSEISFTTPGVYGQTYSAECTIPTGKYFLVPLLVGVCDSTVPDPRSATDKIEDKWACAKDADEVFKTWEEVLDERVLFKNSGTIVVHKERRDRLECAVTISLYLSATILSSNDVSLTESPHAIIPLLPISLIW